MRNWSVRVLLVAVVWLGLSTVGMHARDRAVEWAGADEAALHELLEGASGQREVWDTVPHLVILRSVMDFSGPEMASGYTATADELTEEEIDQLASDLTRALGSLTGGRLLAFSGVRVESLAPGQTVPMFRRGAVVVGQFRGVLALAGTVGFGGRTARDGAITSGAVILDRDFDQASDHRQMLRTHELGHALGYNHVESRQSVMNPRVGVDLTEFDRNAIEFAFLTGPVDGPAVPAVRLSLTH